MQRAPAGSANVSGDTATNRRAKSLDELFSRDDGPKDFTPAEWKTLKKKLYDDGSSNS